MKLGFGVDSGIDAGKLSVLCYYEELSDEGED